MTVASRSGRRGLSSKLVRKLKRDRRVKPSLEGLEQRSLLATALGVTNTNLLIRFDTAAPTVITSAQPITGLAVGDTIEGIDFRPATGQLYALGSGSRLYTIDPLTAAATQVGTDGAFTLVGNEFGFDFNPVPDRIRVVSDLDQNLRLNPNDGTLTATDGTLAYDNTTADGDPIDPNVGVDPNVVASAYINSFAGATVTTLYDIDTNLDILAIQNPPNSGVLNTVGALGVNALDVAGFDIQPLPTGDAAFAALTTDGVASALYSIDLGSGAATPIGNIGAVPTLVRGFAIVPAGTLQFSAPTYSVGESGLLATITVNRIGGSEGIVTVDFTTSDGTATAPDDYTDSDQTLIFGPGVTSQVVLIPLVDDALDEADETVGLALSNPTGGAVLGPQSTAVLTILDDDPTPTLSIDDVTVTEGDAGAVLATFTVTLSAASGLPVTVLAQTADGTATSPADYVAVPATLLTFAPGTTTQTVSVPVNGDLLDEADETFFVDLSAPVNATIADGQGVGTILDDDPTPTLSIDDVTVTEGDAGAVLATFTVTLSAQSGLPVTVLAQTADGSATAPGDYTTVPPTLLTFTPGTTTQTVSVSVNGDFLDEADETYFVNLSGALNATIADGQGVGTITDDDVLEPANVFGVDAANNLVRFNSSAPGTVVSTTAITGLQVGETVLGIDVRPATGQLFALGSTSRLYVVNANTGAATQVGAGTFAVPLNGVEFGFDFNPTVDRIRVVSDANQNLRLNPNDGTVVDFDAATPGVQPDLDLNYAAGDANAGAEPNVVASGYTNSINGATTTTLYGIDTGLDILATQAPPNNGALNTVGGLGVDATDVLGFDIRGATGTALASLVVGGVPGLYLIDLATGAATQIGPVGGGVTLRGLAIASEGFTATLVGTTATFNGGPASDSITFDQSGGLLRHNRFSAGDPGFNSDFDFDPETLGDQTLSASDPAVTIIVNAAGGDDQTTIGSAAAPASGLAATFQVNGDAGGDGVTIDNTADGTGRVVTVNGGTVTGIGGPITIGGVEGLTVNAGSGGDRFNVLATSARTSINAGDGDDTVAFADGASLSGGLLDGGTGTNTLDYSAYSTAVNVDLSAAQTQSLFLAMLSGAQEPGPLSSSPGSGSGVFTLDAAQTALTFNITFQGLVGATVVGTHFHNAPAGVNGPIVRGLDPSEQVDITPPDGFLSGVWSSTDPAGIGGIPSSGPLTPALVAELLANRIYFNIHTNLFPGGEIRGQLLAQGTVSPATGTGGVRGFDNVIGGSAADVITGNANVNNLSGGAGNDTINGGPAADVLNGGGDDDTLVGNTGGDTMNGDGGNDLLVWNNGDGSDLMEGGDGTDTVQVNGSPTGGDAFLIQVNPADSTRLRFDRTNLGLFNLNIGTTEALDFNTLGGDDTTTVDFAGGNPIPVNGIDFDGGAGDEGTPTTDRLVLQRSAGTFAATDEIYTATGPGAGNINLDGSVVTFSNLTPVDDTVPATNFTFNAPAGAQQINLVGGPVVSGFQTTQINDNGTNAFELINFANKANVVVNTAGGDDTVNLLANPAADLASLTVNVDGGSDVVNVVGAGLPADTTTRIDGGAGDFDILNFDAGGAAVSTTFDPATGETTITRAGSGSVVFLNFEQADVPSANAIGVNPANNTLVRFNTATPGTIVSTTPITGLAAGETILGIDFRPAGNNPGASDFTPGLFGLGSTGVIYSINPTTGVATLRSTLAADPADATSPFTGLVGTNFGVDFNPVPDRLRVVSDTGQNLRINVDTGLVTTDGAINPGTPNVVGSAYTNSFVGATGTTLYAIDSTTDQLSIQNPPNNGTLALVGPLNVDASAVLGFDIRPGTNTGLATLVVGGVSSLFSINLATGNATLIGAIGGGSTLSGLALVPNGTLNFSAPTYTVVEGQPFATITVNRVAGDDGTVTVTFSTSAGTATPGLDYNDVTTTVTFADGDQTPQTVMVPIIDDALFEFFPNETVNLALTSPTGGAVLGAQATAELQIIDNEPRTLSINDVTVNEGSTPGTVNAVFTVSLNAASGQTITVDFTTADGTATAPADYATTAGTLTFAPGVTTQTITVPIVSDNLDEDTEIFVVNLSGAVNALVSDPQGVGTILDDDGPVVVADGTTITGVEGQSITRVVATFVDTNGAGPVANYSATIDWGDGTPMTAGVITFAGGTFSVTGTHTYNDPGTFQLTTTITETGGGTAIANGQAVIADAALTATGVAVTATVGTPLNNVIVANATDVGGPEPGSEYRALVNFGDGTGAQAATLTAVGTALTVSSDHTFASAGAFNGTVTIIAADGSETTVPFTSTALAPALTIIPIAATEDVLLNNVVVASLTAGGGPAPVGNFYNAVIDWGDGTDPTIGFVDVSMADPTTPAIAIRGSHLYVESGTYTIRVTVGAEGNPNIVTATGQIAVADVPIVLTGALAPESDTGLSNSDRITADNTPTFFGTSEPGSIVRVFADALVIAAGVTDAAGRFVVTSNVALPDGSYGITFGAVDRNGVTTATAPGGILVVDTVGPKVSDLVFDRLNGRLGVAFQDERSGLDQRTLIDGSNYRFTGRTVTGNTGPFLVTSLAASPATSPTAAQAVTVVINNGRRIRGGRFRFAVRSGGIQDVAGNALDGEFFGFFPSGNNQRGGDFIAGITAIHRTIFAPVPVENGFATPLNPPGRPGSSSRIGNGTQANRQRQAAQARQASPGPAVHDAALDQVRVPRRTPRQR